jgi:hypothetical protein
MSPYDRIATEAEIEEIAGRTGWLIPANRDAAGVLTFQHPQHPIQLIIRSHVGPDNRRDFFVITFSDPGYVAFFSRHGGWGDFGAFLGGGLFMMLGLKLEIFLRDCFAKDYEQYLQRQAEPLPFGYVHPWQLES